MLNSASNSSHLPLIKQDLRKKQERFSERNDPGCALWTTADLLSILTTLHGHLLQLGQQKEHSFQTAVAEQAHLCGHRLRGRVTQLKNS